jgi:DNA-binding NarL/FixJ family response regulator
MLLMMASVLPPASPNQNRIRVLIVDDAPQVRRDLCQVLELTGLIEVVAEASNGQDAMRLVAEAAPDVVVMDLEMPGMDGFEATRLIRAQGPAPRFVILSVHADPEDIERARAAGADDFVVKGANFNVLVNAILARNDPPNYIDSKKGQ